MVKLRPLYRDDFDEIDRIWRAHHKQNFSVPDLDHRITDAVAADEFNKIIAYGQVEHFAVATFIPDLDVSARKRVEALKLLMTEALRGTHEVGIKNLYAFIHDPDFSLLIQKHFGFEVVHNPGEVLLREI